MIEKYIIKNNKLNPYWEQNLKEISLVSNRSKQLEPVRRGY